MLWGVHGGTVGAMHHFSRDELRRAPASAYCATQSVRFQDVDAAGVVFFSRFFDYVHDAYVSFLSELGAPLHEALKERLWAAPLRHAEADYLSPLRFGDSFEVLWVAAALDSTEMALGFRLESGGGRPFALVQTVHTFVDLTSFERREVLPQIRKAIVEAFPVDGP